MEDPGRRFHPQAPVLDVPHPEGTGQLALWADGRLAGMSVREIAGPEQIRDRVAALAEAITHEYHGHPLMLAVVLRGAFVFAADLARELIAQGMEDLNITFFHASSYRGTRAFREPVIQELGEVDTQRHSIILVIDDIVDAGHTAAAMRARLSGPGKVLEFCTLLDRPERREVEVHPRFVGFSLRGPGFVVGYGLDYDGRYRELPYLAQWQPVAAPLELRPEEPALAPEQPSATPEPAQLGLLT